MKRTAVVLTLYLISPLHAATGQWLPQQLPTIEGALHQAGIAVDPRQLADPARYPWNAVIRFGAGCSASLVSPMGLIIVSRDCVPDDVAGEVDAERDPSSGFVAATLGEELPGGADLRAEIIDGVSDITTAIRGDSQDSPSAAEIAARGAQLVAACEIGGSYHCSVEANDAGAQYRLIRRVRIADLRLVYRPASATAQGAGPPAGLLALYRAYVGPDGQAGGFSESNVPYRPGAYLRLQAAGSKGGDFVFSAGYPATAADAPLRVAYGHVQADSVGAVVRHNRVAGAAEPAAAQAVEATAGNSAGDAAAPNLLQVDLDPIGRGGGPLLNARAELVGVTIASAVRAQTTDAAPALATVAAVDIRDLLRQMQAVPGAEGLLQEIGVQAVVADGQ